MSSTFSFANSLALHYTSTLEGRQYENMVKDNLFRNINKVFYQKNKVGFSQGDNSQYLK